MPTDTKTEPAHYRDCPVPAVVVVDAWRLDFYLGQVVKYIQRRGTKPGESELDDLRKARWYLNYRIAQLEKEQPANG